MFHFTLLCLVLKTVNRHVKKISKQKYIIITYTQYQKAYNIFLYYTMSLPKYLLENKYEIHNVCAKKQTIQTKFIWDVFFYFVCNLTRNLKRSYENLAKKLLTGIRIGIERVDIYQI